MNRIPAKDNSARQKYRLTIFIAAPFFLIGIFFLLFYKKPFYIIPSNSTTKLVLSSYDDKPLGNSRIWVQEDSSATNVRYRYVLRQGFTFPFVGILFSKQDSSFFDLSAYDHLRIKIKATAGTRVPVTITSDIPGYSSETKHLSFRNTQYVLTVSDQASEIIAPIRKFETPDWWYSANNKTEKDLGPPDLSKVRTVQLGNCINIKKDSEDTITVEEMSFHVALQPFFLYSGIFLFLYAGSGLFFYRKKSATKPEINFQYEKTETINHLEKEEETVFGFITSNYSNAELTIIDVQTSVGLHERKISAIIKKKTDLNFKQFLNKLRISEAKRLLSSTDLQISEIAFKVGYGNASHFNRVFKNTENCSPNDYRKEHSGTVQ